MPTCIIRGCKNSSAFQNKALGVTFHKFPTDMFWKTKWIKLIRRNRNDPEWLPSKFSVLCSSHFEECDLHLTKGGLRRVHKNALPGRIKLVNSKWCLDVERPSVPIYKREYGDFSVTSTQENTGDSEIKQEIDEDYQFDHIPPETLVISCTPNEDMPELDSDESMFDSPNENILRNRVKRLQTRGKLQARRIKTLTQHIRRLKRSNMCLKTIVNDLKQKLNIDTSSDPSKT